MNKNPGAIRCVQREVRFFKLRFSGVFLAFYKHIFESDSFLIASITALTIHKSLIKISVCQTSGTNRISARQERLTAWRCSALPMRQPADLHRVVADKLCLLNKLHSKGDSFHSALPKYLSILLNPHPAANSSLARCKAKDVSPHLSLGGPHELQPLFLFVSS